MEKTELKANWKYEYITSQPPSVTHTAAHALPCGPVVCGLARAIYLSHLLFIFAVPGPKGQTLSAATQEKQPLPLLSLLWPEDNATAHPATHPAIHPARFFSMRGRKCVSVKSSLQLHLWSLDLITTAASDYRRLQRLQPCENVSSPAGASLARTLRGRVQHKIGAVCNRQIKTSTKNDNNKRGNRKVSVWTSRKKKKKERIDASVVVRCESTLA